MRALLSDDNLHAGHSLSLRLLVCFQRFTFVNAGGRHLTRIGFVIRVVWHGGKYAGSGVRLHA